jgi:hypothetical protein
MPNGVRVPSNCVPDRPLLIPPTHARAGAGCDSSADKPELELDVSIGEFAGDADVVRVGTVVAGSDRVVAYSMVGGAVGPHYTEFREERSVLPGILLARVVGYSPDIGRVALSVTSGGTLRAAVADDAEGGARYLFEFPVTRLLPW